jgi:hypothetical protein
MNRINAPVQGAVLGREQFPRSVSRCLAGKVTRPCEGYLDVKAGTPGMRSQRTRLDRAERRPIIRRVDRKGVD